MKSQEITTFAGALVVLGIVFGATDRLIGYLFMGTGVLLSIVSAIKSKKKFKIEESLHL